MPDTANRPPIQAAWIIFLESAGTLLVPQKDDQPLDQYLAFRDDVLRLAQEEDFLNALNSAFSNTTGTPPLPQPPEMIRDALLHELQAFPRAVEVARTVEKTKRGKGLLKTIRTKLLGRASTTVGSVKDLLESLPPWAKMVLTLLKELFDLFKGTN